MKNQHAVKLGRTGGQSKSDKKANAARENGKKGGKPKIIELHDVKKFPVKVYCEVSDGSKFVMVMHLDGMYSYCKTEKGATVHLSRMAPLTKYEDGYKLV